MLKISTFITKCQESLSIDKIYNTFEDTPYKLSIDLIIAPIVEATNINNWHKFKKIVKENSENSKSNYVALFVWAKSDYNGAFNHISDDFLDGVNRLSKHFRIVSKNVGNFDQLNEIMKEIHSKERKIKMLYIGAHGNPKEIALNDDAEGDIHAIDTGKIDFQYFPRDNATIVLDSCSTGGHYLNNTKSLNFADWIKYNTLKAKKDITVIASSSTLVTGDIKFENPKKLFFRCVHESQDTTYSPTTQWITQNQHRFERKQSSYEARKEIKTPLSTLPLASSN